MLHFSDKTARTGDPARVLTFRDGEISHSKYSDLVGNVLEIKVKPHLEWNAKKYQCRKVTIPQSLAGSIGVRGKHVTTMIIFRNAGGKPNQHLLRELQALTADNPSNSYRTAQAGVPLPPA